MLSKIATISRPKSLGLLTEDSLGEQAKGKELEYRIIAVNKAGEGQASNTVMVVI